MNKIFKLKFSKARNQLVVVSEIENRADKSTAVNQVADVSVDAGLVDGIDQLQAQLNPDFTGVKLNQDLTTKTLTKVSFGARDYSLKAQAFASALNRALKKSAFATSALALALPLLATSANLNQAQASDLRSGFDVVAGVAKLENQANITRITTKGNTIINWQKFGIGTNELVEFIQENSKSASLNRVLGGQVSKILGQLRSNGQVFVVNPAGIVIGKDAVVDTSGFVASALDVSNKDFLDQKAVFTSDKEKVAAAVINQGLIKVNSNGTLALVGGRVLNNGVLQAKGGSVFLLAGQSITISDFNNPAISFKVKAGNVAVNLGEVLGQNVRVLGHKVQHGTGVSDDLTSLFAGVTPSRPRAVISATGTVELFAGSEADELQATNDANAQVKGARTGSVQVGKADILAGGAALKHQDKQAQAAQSAQVSRGVTAADKTLSAATKAPTLTKSSTAQAQLSQVEPGTVRLLGDKVELNSGAVVDASAAVVAGKFASAGTVFLGGDHKGAGAFKIAEELRLEGGSVVKAASAVTQADLEAALATDAQAQGSALVAQALKQSLAKTKDAGAVFGYAKKAYYFGTLDASSASANAGLVETSGGWLTFGAGVRGQGWVNVLLNGAINGTWLIDPRNVIVVDDSVTFDDSGNVQYSGGFHSLFGTPGRSKYELTIHDKGRFAQSKGETTFLHLSDLTGNPQKTKIDADDTVMFWFEKQTDLSASLESLEVNAKDIVFKNVTWNNKKFSANNDVTGVKDGFRSTQVLYINSNLNFSDYSGDWNLGINNKLINTNLTAKTITDKNLWLAPPSEAVIEFDKNNGRKAWTFIKQKLDADPTYGGQDEAAFIASLASKTGVDVDLNQYPETHLFGSHIRTTEGDVDLKHVALGIMNNLQEDTVGVHRGQGNSTKNKLEITESSGNHWWMPEAWYQRLKTGYHNTIREEGQSPDYDKAKQYHAGTGLDYDKLWPADLATKGAEIYAEDGRSFKTQPTIEDKPQLTKFSSIVAAAEADVTKLGTVKVKNNDEGKTDAGSVNLLDTENANLANYFTEYTKEGNTLIPPEKQKYVLDFGDDNYSARYNVKIAHMPAYRHRSPLFADREKSGTHIIAGTGDVSLLTGQSIALGDTTSGGNHVGPYIYGRDEALQLTGVNFRAGQDLQLGGDTPTYKWAAEHYDKRIIFRAGRDFKSASKDNLNLSAAWVDVGGNWDLIQPGSASLTGLNAKVGGDVNIILTSGGKNDKAKFNDPSLPTDNLGANIVNLVGTSIDAKKINIRGGTLAYTDSTLKGNATVVVDTVTDHSNTTPVANTNSPNLFEGDDTSVVIKAKNSVTLTGKVDAGKVTLISESGSVKVNMTNDWKIKNANVTAAGDVGINSVQDPHQKDTTTGVNSDQPKRYNFGAPNTSTEAGKYVPPADSSVDIKGATVTIPDGNAGGKIASKVLNLTKTTEEANFSLPELVNPKTDLNLNGSDQSSIQFDHDFSAGNVSIEGMKQVTIGRELTPEDTVHPFTPEQRDQNAPGNNTVNEKQNIEHGTPVNNVSLTSLTVNGPTDFKGTNLTTTYGVKVIGDANVANSKITTGVNGDQPDTAPVPDGFDRDIKFEEGTTTVHGGSDLTSAGNVKFDGDTKLIGSHVKAKEKLIAEGDSFYQGPGERDSLTSSDLPVKQGQTRAEACNIENAIAGNDPVCDKPHGSFVETDGGVEIKTDNVNLDSSANVAKEGIKTKGDLVIGKDDASTEAYYNGVELEGKNVTLNGSQTLSGTVLTAQENLTVNGSLTAQSAIPETNPEKLTGAPKEGEPENPEDSYYSSLIKVGGTATVKGDTILQNNTSLTADKLVINPSDTVTFTDSSVNTNGTTILAEDPDSVTVTFDRSEKAKGDNPVYQPTGVDTGTGKLVIGAKPNPDETASAPGKYNPNRPIGEVNIEDTPLTGSGVDVTGNTVNLNNVTSTYKEYPEGQQPTERENGDFKVTGVEEVVTQQTCVTTPGNFTAITPNFHNEGDEPSKISADKGVVFTSCVTVTRANPDAPVSEDNPEVPQPFTFAEANRPDDSKVDLTNLTVESQGTTQIQTKTLVQNNAGITSNKLDVNTKDSLFGNSSVVTKEGARIQVEGGNFVFTNQEVDPDKPKDSNKAARKNKNPADNKPILSGGAGKLTIANRIRKDNEVSPDSEKPFDFTDERAGDANITLANVKVGGKDVELAGHEVTLNNVQNVTSTETQAELAKVFNKDPDGDGPESAPDNVGKVPELGKLLVNSDKTSLLNPNLTTTEDMIFVTRGEDNADDNDPTDPVFKVTKSEPERGKEAPKSKLSAGGNLVVTTNVVNPEGALPEDPNNPQEGEAKVFTFSDTTRPAGTTIDLSNVDASAGKKLQAQATNVVAGEANLTAAEKVDVNSEKTLLRNTNVVGKDGVRIQVENGTFVAVYTPDKDNQLTDSIGNPSVLEAKTKAAPDTDSPAQPGVIYGGGTGVNIASKIRVADEVSPETTKPHDFSEDKRGTANVTLGNVKVGGDSVNLAANKVTLNQVGQPTEGEVKAVDPQAPFKSTKDLNVNSGSTTLTDSNINVTGNFSVLVAGEKDEDGTLVNDATTPAFTTHRGDDPTSTTVKTGNFTVSTAVKKVPTGAPTTPDDPSTAPTEDKLFTFSDGHRPETEESPSGQTIDLTGLKVNADGTTQLLATNLVADETSLVSDKIDVNSKNTLLRNSNVVSRDATRIQVEGGNFIVDNDPDAVDNLVEKVADPQSVNDYNNEVKEREPLPANPANPEELTNKKQPGVFGSLGKVTVAGKVRTAEEVSPESERPFDYSPDKRDNANITLANAKLTATDLELAGNTVTLRNPENASDDQLKQVLKDNPDMTASKEGASPVAPEAVKSKLDNVRINSEKTLLESPLLNITDDFTAQVESDDPDAFVLTGPDQDAQDQGVPPSKLKTGGDFVVSSVVRKPNSEDPTALDEADKFTFSNTNDADNPNRTRKNGGIILNNANVEAGGQLGLQQKNVVADGSQLTGGHVDVNSENTVLRNTGLTSDGDVRIQVENGTFLKYNTPNGEGGEEFPNSDNEFDLSPDKIGAFKDEAIHNKDNQDNPPESPDVNTGLIANGKLTIASKIRVDEEISPNSDRPFDFTPEKRGEASIILSNQAVSASELNLAGKEVQLDNVKNAAPEQVEQVKDKLNFLHQIPNPDYQEGTSDPSTTPPFITDPNFTLQKIELGKVQVNSETTKLHNPELTAAGDVTILVAKPDPAGNEPVFSTSSDNDDQLGRISTNGNFTVTTGTADDEAGNAQTFSYKDTPRVPNSTIELKNLKVESEKSVQLLADNVAVDKSDLEGDHLEVNSQNTIVRNSDLVSKSGTRVQVEDGNFVYVNTGDNTDDEVATKELKELFGSGNNNDEAVKKYADKVDEFTRDPENKPVRTPKTPENALDDSDNPKHPGRILTGDGDLQISGKIRKDDEVSPVTEKAFDYSVEKRADANVTLGNVDLGGRNVDIAAKTVNLNNVANADPVAEQAEYNSRYGTNKPADGTSAGTPKVQATPLQNLRVNSEQTNLHNPDLEFANNVTIQVESDGDAFNYSADRPEETPVGQPAPGKLKAGKDLVISSLVRSEETALNEDKKFTFADTKGEGDKANNTRKEGSIHLTNANLQAGEQLGLQQKNVLVDNTAVNGGTLDVNSVNTVVRNSDFNSENGTRIQVEGGSFVKYNTDNPEDLIPGVNNDGTEENPASVADQVAKALEEAQKGEELTAPTDTNRNGLYAGNGDLTIAGKIRTDNEVSPDTERRFDYGQEKQGKANIVLRNTGLQAKDVELAGDNLTLDKVKNAELEAVKKYYNDLHTTDGALEPGYTAPEQTPENLRVNTETTTYKDTALAFSKNVTIQVEGNNGTTVDNPVFDYKVSEPVSGDGESTNNTFLKAGGDLTISTLVRADRDQEPGKLDEENKFTYADGHRKADSTINLKDANLQAGKSVELLAENVLADEAKVEGDRLKVNSETTVVKDSTFNSQHGTTIQVEGGSFVAFNTPARSEGDSSLATKLKDHQDDVKKAKDAANGDPEALAKALKVGDFAKTLVKDYTAKQEVPDNRKHDLLAGDGNLAIVGRVRKGDEVSPESERVFDYDQGTRTGNSDDTTILLSSVDVGAKNLQLAATSVLLGNVGNADPDKAKEYYSANPTVGADGQPVTTTPASLKDVDINSETTHLHNPRLEANGEVIVQVESDKNSPTVKAQLSDATKAVKGEEANPEEQDRHGFVYTADPIREDGDNNLNVTAAEGNYLKADNITIAGLVRTNTKDQPEPGVNADGNVEESSADPALRFTYHPGRRAGADIALTNANLLSKNNIELAGGDVQIQQDSVLVAGAGEGEGYKNPKDIAKGAQATGTGEIKINSNQTHVLNAKLDAANGITVETEGEPAEGTDPNEHYSFIATNTQPLADPTKAPTEPDEAALDPANRQGLFAGDGKLTVAKSVRGTPDEKSDQANTQFWDDATRATGNVVLANTPLAAAGVDLAGDQVTLKTLDTRKADGSPSITADSRINSHNTSVTDVNFQSTGGLIVQAADKVTTDATGAPTGGEKGNVVFTTSPAANSDNGDDTNNGDGPTSTYKPTGIVKLGGDFIVTRDAHQKNADGTPATGEFTYHPDSRVGTTSLNVSVDAQGVEVASDKLDVNADIKTSEGKFNTHEFNLNASAIDSTGGLTIQVEDQADADGVTQPGQFNLNPAFNKDAAGAGNGAGNGGSGVAGSGSADPSTAKVNPGLRAANDLVLVGKVRVADGEHKDTSDKPFTYHQDNRGNLQVKINSAAADAPVELKGRNVEIAADKLDLAPNTKVTADKELKVNTVDTVMTNVDLKAPEGINIQVEDGSFTYQYLNPALENGQPVDPEAYAKLKDIYKAKLIAAGVPEEDITDEVLAAQIAKHNPEAGKVIEAGKHFQVADRIRTAGEKEDTSAVEFDFSPNKRGQFGKALLRDVEVKADKVALAKDDLDVQRFKTTTDSFSANAGRLSLLDSAIEAAQDIKLSATGPVALGLSQEAAALPDDNTPEAQAALGKALPYGNKLKGQNLNLGNFSDGDKPFTWHGNNRISGFNSVKDRTNPHATDDPDYVAPRQDSAANGTVSVNKLNLDIANKLEVSTNALSLKDSQASGKQIKLNTVSTDADNSRLVATDSLDIQVEGGEFNYHHDSDDYARDEAAGKLGLGATNGPVTIAGKIRTADEESPESARKFDFSADKRPAGSAIKLGKVNLISGTADNPQDVNLAAETVALNTFSANVDNFKLNAKEATLDAFKLKAKSDVVLGVSDSLTVGINPADTNSATSLDPTKAPANSIVAGGDLVANADGTKTTDAKAGKVSIAGTSLSANNAYLAAEQLSLVATGTQVDYDALPEAQQQLYNVKTVAAAEKVKWFKGENRRDLLTDDPAKLPLTGNRFVQDRFKYERDGATLRPTYQIGAFFTGNFQANADSFSADKSPIYADNLAVVANSARFVHSELSANQDVTITAKPTTLGDGSLAAAQASKVGSLYFDHAHIFADRVVVAGAAPDGNVAAESGYQAGHTNNGFAGGSLKYVLIDSCAYGSSLSVTNVGNAAHLCGVTEPQPTPIVAPKLDVKAPDVSLPDPNGINLALPQQAVARDAVTITDDVVVGKSENFGKGTAGPVNPAGEANGGLNFSKDTNLKSEQVAGHTQGTSTTTLEGNLFAPEVVETQELSLGQNLTAKDSPLTPKALIVAADGTVVQTKAKNSRAVLDGSFFTGDQPPPVQGRRVETADVKTADGEQVQVVVTDAQTQYRDAQGNPLDE